MHTPFHYTLFFLETSRHEHPSPSIPTPFCYKLADVNIPLLLPPPF